MDAKKEEFETSHATSVKYHQERRKNDPEYVKLQKEYDRQHLKNPDLLDKECS